MFQNKHKSQTNPFQSILSCEAAETQLRFLCLDFWILLCLDFSMQGQLKKITKTKELYYIKEFPYLLKICLLSWIFLYITEKCPHHNIPMPEGWITVTHLCGIKVYLHRESRVCTVSRPYFLGPSSVRVSFSFSLVFYYFFVLVPRN